MREIKFRAWDNELNKYFEPIYEAYKGRLLDLTISFSGELIKRTLKEPAIHESVFKGKYKLEQFTGLKDKNGVDIYEGDILYYTIFGYNDNDKQYKGVVKWFGSGFAVTQIPDDEGNGEYGIELFWIHNQDCELEIIGNIHENPELLK